MDENEQTGVTDETSKPNLRWLALAGAGLGGLLLGIAIGASGDDAEPAATPEPQPTVTETVTVEVDPSQAREDELDERAAELESQAKELETREGELDERATALDEREAELTQQEEQVAANTITNGVWTVGVDIEPGTYRAVDVSGDCYWGIYKTGTNQSEIIDNGIPGGGNPQVTLSEGQDFESSRCGEWMKQ